MITDRGVNSYFFMCIEVSDTVLYVQVVTKGRSQLLDQIIIVRCFDSGNAMIGVLKSSPLFECGAVIRNMLLLPYL